MTQIKKFTTAPALLIKVVFVLQKKSEKVTHRSSIFFSWLFVSAPLFIVRQAHQGRIADRDVVYV